MIIINDTLGAYGGGQTLILRMCTWMKSKNIKSVILCDNADNTEIVEAIKNLGTDIIIVNIYNFKALGAVIKSLQFEDEIKVINFVWNQYLSMEIAKKETSLEFDNYMYCIHPQTLKKGNSISISFLQSYLVKEYGNILDRINENKALLMMDEINWKITEEYFKRGIKLKQPIIRIPMFIEEDSEKDEIIRKGFENNILFTSARAEFPFKGYMIGMIEAFTIIKASYPDSKLVIVSGGDDYNQLVAKINEFPDCIRESIELHRWMKYDKLVNLTKSAKIVIGMGTTILDAARIYKPCIPVCTYTMECKADGYFDENPYNLNAVNGNVSIIDLIGEVFELNYKDYKAKAEKSFEAVRKTYEIGQVMEQLLSLKTNHKNCILKSAEIAEHKLANIYRKIRYRNQREFDYKRIKKEE